MEVQFRFDVATSGNLGQITVRLDSGPFTETSSLHAHRGAHGHAGGAPDHACASTMGATNVSTLSAFVFVQINP